MGILSREKHPLQQFHSKKGVGLLREIMVLQVIKNWSQGRLGNEVSTSRYIAYKEYAELAVTFNTNTLCRKRPILSILLQWTLVYPATTGLDHGQISEIATYVNHHAQRVYNVSLLALPFLFLSCYPSSMQIIIVFWPLQA